MFAFIRFCRERNPGLGAGGPRAAAHGAATTCATNGRTFSVCLVCLHHFSVFFSHFQPVFRHCKIVLAFILACHCNGLLLRRAQQLSFEVVTSVFFADFAEFCGGWKTLRRPCQLDLPWEWSFLDLFYGQPDFPWKRLKWEAERSGHMSPSRHVICQICYVTSCDTTCRKIYVMPGSRCFSPKSSRLHLSAIRRHCPCELWPMETLPLAPDGWTTEVDWSIIEREIDLAGWLWGVSIVDMFSHLFSAHCSHLFC